MNQMSIYMKRVKLSNHVCARICLIRVFFDDVTVTSLNTLEYALNSND